jgi:hypothetical protein
VSNVVDLLQGACVLVLVGIAIAYCFAFLAVGIATGAGTETHEVFPRGRDRFVAGLILWLPGAFCAGLIVAAAGRSL